MKKYITYEEPLINMVKIWSIWGNKIIPKK